MNSDEPVCDGDRTHGPGARGLLLTRVPIVDGALDHYGPAVVSDRRHRLRSTRAADGRECANPLRHDYVSPGLSRPVPTSSGHTLIGEDPASEQLYEQEEPCERGAEAGDEDGLRTGGAAF